MSDFIFIRKSRNTLSSVLHVLMNILLGVGSIFITVISGSWVLGILLVLLSKWRIFAVRPRYWFLNLKSSLVDLIVGSSFVILAYCSGTELLFVHYLLAALYSVWLTLIKPRTSPNFILVQSLAALFFGSTAAILATVSVDPVFLVLTEFIIGYGASRHLFAQNSSSSFTLPTFVLGLFCAEIAWLCSTWDIIYSFGSTGIIIPQFAIIITLAGFAVSKVLLSISKHDGELRKKECYPAAIFSIVVILIIIFAFSNPIFNI